MDHLSLRSSCRKPESSLQSLRYFPEFEHSAYTHILLIRTGHESLHELLTCSKWSDKALGSHDCRRDHGSRGDSQEGQTQQPTNSFHLILTLLLPLNLQRSVSLLSGFRAASAPPVTSPLPYPTPQENPPSLSRTSTLRTLQGLVHQLGTLGICGNVFTDGPPSIYHPLFILWSKKRLLLLVCQLLQAGGKERFPHPPVSLVALRTTSSSDSDRMGAEGPDHASVRALDRLCPLDSSRKGI